MKELFIVSINRGRVFSHVWEGGRGRSRWLGTWSGYAICASGERGRSRKGKGKGGEKLWDFAPLTLHYYCHIARQGAHWIFFVACGKWHCICPWYCIYIHTCMHPTPYNGEEKPPKLRPRVRPPPPPPKNFPVGRQRGQNPKNPASCSRSSSFKVCYPRNARCSRQYSKAHDIKYRVRKPDNINGQHARRRYARRGYAQRERGLAFAFEEAAGSC